MNRLPGGNTTSVRPGRWTPPQRLFFWCALAAGLAWSATVLCASDGWSLDDELSHYLRSRSVWQNPILLLDTWTRVGRNLFHVLPAPFGLTATRLWTLGFAGLAVGLTALLAARLGARRAWLAPLVLCFQPWFVELSWGVLTQTPFMLALVAGVLGIAGNRLILAGLCFGALPLIRHEGIALTGLWIAILAGRTLVISRHDWRRALIAAIMTAAPIIACNLSTWVFLGELPLRVFLSAKPTEIYGHGTLWHFIPISILPAGVFTLALSAVGLPSVCRNWKATWPLIFFPAYFILHSLIYWRGLFASGGYYHFLMPMAPGLAVAALFGADALLDAPARAAGRTGIALLSGAVLQGLLMVHLWRDGHPHFTLIRDPIDRAIDAALDWQKKERPRAAAVVCHHIYAAWREDWIETPARRRLDATPISELPPGCVVLWEEKYSDLTGLPLDALKSDPAWRECTTFGGGSVRVFEKIR
ncbi:MAG: hypothetical protein PHC88_07555 [Terrimicrobiaceae bacterium]|nr:hypothetical protein [Terrimicrobiaceae bacterium]